MEIIKLGLDELKPYEKNAKRHPEKQIEQIKKSIEQFGNNDPIAVWGDDNTIVEGHGRYIALKELGYTEAECIRLDHLTDEERKAYTLAHNKLTMNSDFDFEILDEELKDIIDIDMSDFGFDVEIQHESTSSTTNENDENEFADIEKLEKHYGVPYQGNKSRIADIIVSILPEGKRLVDLFGGGGAITHCAMLNDKWESYLYNDINPMITGLFMDAVHGKYHDEKRVITRADFEELKDTDAYVKYIWSFGNNGTGYLWGEDIEEIKCMACHAVIDEDLRDRRLAYMRFLRLLKEKTNMNRLESIERIEELHALESLERLHALESLEVSNIDYHNYEYQDGDIVYCDIPYEQSGKGKCDDYGVKFDSKEFYEWVKSRDYQVFFSSYEISDDAFYKQKIKSVMSLIGADTNGKKVNEYIYSNKPIKTEKVV